MGKNYSTMQNVVHSWTAWLRTSVAVVQVSACITRQISGSSASYMQMIWSFLRTRRRICSLGSTQLLIGDVSGDSLLASALISPQWWCLVRRGKCPLAQSRWTASISQWYALTGTSASFWRHHYAGPITSTISPLAASGCLHKPQLGRAARISQFLSVVSYCPLTCSRAQRLDWSLQARAFQHCLSSTDHSAGGVVISCGGQRALPMRRSSANWGSSTRPAWFTVKLCPYLAAWRRWIQEPAHYPCGSLPLGDSCPWHLGTLVSFSLGPSLMLAPRTLWRWTRKHSKHITTLVRTRSGSSTWSRLASAACAWPLCSPHCPLWLLILGLHIEPYDPWPWSWPCRCSMVGSCPDTVMTHALVSAFVGIVEMLLVAPFAVPPLERFTIAWRLAPPLTICDFNGVQQQVSTCATPLSGRPMRGSLTRYIASTLPAPSEHMLSSWLACVRALTKQWGVEAFFFLWAFVVSLFFRTHVTHTWSCQGHYLLWERISQLFKVLSRIMKVPPWNRCSMSQRN